LRSRNKKRKSAYRRGEKLALFFKRGTVFLLFVVLIAVAVLGVKVLARNFQIREIIVSGNYHLDIEEITESVEIKKGESLLDIRFSDISERLKHNAWIKKVALKKQFPGTLLIKVEEAEPGALLSINKQLYLIDKDGKTLERIKGESTLFLPVIKDINPKNKKGISEALKLVGVISRKNVLNERETVEVGLESYGLTMDIDGEFIKVGYGNYSEKLERWMELEPEIRKRGVPIKYVDLRFKDSVIVKPIKKSNKGSS
jgi:cell division protein FtsQ